jgi:Mrp family chromosome partitioning ATPase
MSKNFGILSAIDEERKPSSNGVNGSHEQRKATPVRDARPFMANEEETKLVQRLFLLSDPGAFRTVVFCGVEQDDGASAICANTGKILAAKVEKPVCIVDASLVTGDLHKLFGVSNDKGLTESLLHFDSVRNYVQQVGNNLWLMPCRQGSAGSQVSIANDRLSQRIRELRTEFEYVLIQAPAVNASGDAAQLGRLADGVVLIVRANTTRKETAVKAKESLQYANVTLLGAVLNKRTFPIPKALYRVL